MTIRKADSKGRLTGFVPGGIYEIETGADEVTVVTRDPAERSRTLPQPVSHAAIEYLESFQIDAHLCLRDGHNRLGRWEMPPRGMARTSDDKNAWWVEWPEGFDYDEFVTLAWQ